MEDGYILCNCQDEICRCKQRWSHVEIFNISLEFGLYPKDLLTLVDEKY